MEIYVSLSGRRDLSGEIYRQLRRAILDRRLQPGEALPPTRGLASSLGVSRSTVSVAYDRLWSEGLVTSRIGAGTFISQDLPQGREEDSGPPVSVLRARAVWDSIPVPTAFNRPAEFDFRTGIPDASLFPYDVWQRAFRDQIRAESTTRGVYAQPAGDPRLREALARHVAISRGVQTSAEGIVITGGTQQALDVIARALLEPGELVAVEDPSYPPPRLLFQTLGYRVQGVPMDNEGIIVDALPHETRLIYVTPSHQWPLGLSMSFARRMTLLDWAERHNAAIIEDDYDSEFRYGGRPLEPLQTLDSRGRVLYVGSFSKTLLPTLRLGFIVAPPSVRLALQKSKFVTDWHTPLSTQGALAAFIESGGFNRHLRKMRSIYGKRHLLLRTTVAGRLARHLEVLPSNAGLHLTAVARSMSVDQVKEVVRRASNLGVAIQRLASYAYDVPPEPGVLLGYGAISTENIGEGLEILATCFDEVTTA